MLKYEFTSCTLKELLCYIWLMTQRTSVLLNLLNHIQANLLPNTLVFDDGSQFRDTFVEIYEIHDAEWQTSGTQHHSALGIGERYHEPIKRTSRKL